MTELRKRIAFDKDEVIVQFVEPFLTYYNRKHNTQYQRCNMREYYMSKMIGVEQAVMLGHFDEFYNTEHFEQLPLVPGAIEGLQSLATAYDLIMVTARPTHIHSHTQRYVDTYCPNIFSELHLVGDGNRSQRKAEICKARNVFAIVEDNKETAVTCAEYGVRSILLDTPWNQGDVPGIERARSWPELVDIIRSMEGAQ